MIKENQKLKMKNDIMFKAFFSQKGNEEFLEELLSSILKEEVKVKRVTHDARLEQLGKENKYGVLDLDVELENKKIVNVEMQLRDYNNIEERLTAYAGKKISEQLKPKQDYKEIPKVILIAILDYEFIDLPDYLTDTIRVAKNHREYELNNQVEYIYIELGKFRKENPNMSDKLNQWLAFLDMERRDLLEMAMKENKQIEKAMEAYETLAGDEEIKRLAEIRLKAEMEETSALNYERKKGEEIGKKQGEKIGREQGEKIGREQGRKAEKRQIAKKLLEQKMPIEQIIEITELTKEEILEIKIINNI